MGCSPHLVAGAGKHRPVSIKYSMSCDKWPVFALLPPPFPSARQAAHSRQFAQISFPFSENSRDFSSIRAWEKQGERMNCLVRTKSSAKPETRAGCSLGRGFSSSRQSGREDFENLAKNCSSTLCRSDIPHKIAIGTSKFFRSWTY